MRRTGDARGSGWLGLGWVGSGLNGGAALAAVAGLAGAVLALLMCRSAARLEAWPR